ncbi:MAG: ABC transporter ATP-binding protein [Gaiellaceae bacterium]
MRSRHQAGAPNLLDDVSFDIRSGEAVGVVGESGSGKSLLVQSLLMLDAEGLERISGQLVYRGKDLALADSDAIHSLRGKAIAPILPNARSQLNPLVRVGDFMAAVIDPEKKLDFEDVFRRAVRALETVGITDADRRLEAYPHELSGGMAQRVCIALALIHDPDLIVADEPTSGLDVTVQRQVLDLMAARSRERGAAQLIVTRDLGIVAHYCQRVAVLREGRIVELAPTVELFTRPRHPYTQRLIEAVQRSPGAVRQAAGVA